MAIIESSLPKFKSFFKGLCVKDSVRQMVTRFMIAILVRTGRNSCMHGGGVIQGDQRNRAQLTRFLQRSKGRLQSLRSSLTEKLLNQETWRGEYVLLIDSTMVGQQGKTIENTYSTGNRKRRPQKNRRFSKYTHARRSCHCFVFGLLLTPQGLRVPFFKPLYTKAYAQQKGLPHRTQARLAAELIAELPVPEGVSLTVVGDTAFDAETIRQACDQRGYQWIVPCNANRVFAGRRGQRPRVSSRIDQLSKKRFQTIRLKPGSGKHAAQRRLSRYRLGSKSKPRTYYVHAEERDVRSIGKVRLVFSSSKPIEKKPQRKSTKILLSNARRLSARRIVELYGLRWQIELLFKELKGTLGMHQYQFKRFDSVESWISVVLITFIYLEQIRAAKLRDRRLGAKQKSLWQCQRSYGIRQAVLVGIEIRQSQWICQRLKTKTGTEKLKELFQRILAAEYRCSA